jgi:hypothetical protein
MNFIRLIGSAFNTQTVLLLVGLALVVAGVWYLLGLGFGLVALGLALIAIALLINQNTNEGR